MQSNEINIDVKAVNNIGNILLHIVVEIASEEELKFLFSNFIDEIGFSHINSKRQTIAHMMFRNRQIKR